MDDCIRTNVWDRQAIYSEAFENTVLVDQIGQKSEEGQKGMTKTPWHRQLVRCIITRGSK